jgi:hypothetical protein
MQCDRCSVPEVLPSCGYTKLTISRHRQGPNIGGFATLSYLPLAFVNGEQHRFQVNLPCRLFYALLRKTLCPDTEKGNGRWSVSVVASLLLLNSKVECPLAVP